MVRSGKKQKSHPAKIFLLGQEKILPAVPPGLALCARFSHTFHMPTLLTVRPAVSPTAVFPQVRFALESPFGQSLRAELTPPSALCDERSLTYLLFLSGLKLF